MSGKYRRSKLSKNRINFNTFFAVLIVLIILFLVGVYVYFNDEKPPLVLNVLSAIF